MGTFPCISFKELRQRVEHLGFSCIRQKGSHMRYTHPDGRKTTIPDHGSQDVPKGLLTKIVRYDLQLSMKEFFESTGGV